MMRYSCRASVWFLGAAFVLLSLPASGGEIRILFWFDRARPLDTFKFQAYDLRKQEFTPAVEGWIKATRDTSPGYDAYTRDVDLARERGETENLKIGSVITREFIRVGDRIGYQFGTYSGVVSGAAGGGAPTARPVPTKDRQFNNFPIPLPHRITVTRTIMTLQRTPDHDVQPRDRALDADVP